MEDWSPVISDLRPGEEWTLIDCADLSTRVWISDTQPPTADEIQAHYADMTGAEG